MIAGTGKSPVSSACLPLSAGRRRFLGMLLGCAASVLLTGHMPYRQWVVYRARHLFIVTITADTVAGDLADRIAERLAARLPDSGALAAQTRDNEEVIQLLRSHQMPLALLTRDEARVACAGQDKLASIPLRMLASLENHVLVVLEDFPDDKAFDIAAALADFAPAQSVVSESPWVPIWHPGALRFHHARSRQ